MRFVSERALMLHREFLNSERLRLSVIEKSYPELMGKNIKQILRSACGCKNDAVRLKLNIKCHELYFSSFQERYSPSETVRLSYGSEASFLYELGRIAIATEEQFVFISSDRGKIIVKDGGVGVVARFDKDTLVLDLSEHAYFLDYGFDKAAYVQNMISYLNLSVLDKKISSKD